ncbi:unnamed protein product [Gadus morhua 'NCC']
MQTSYPPACPVPVATVLLCHYHPDPCMSCPNLVQSFTICNMRHLLSKGPTTTKVSGGGRRCQCPMLNGFPPLSSVSLSTHAPRPLHPRSSKQPLCVFRRPCTV